MYIHSSTASLGKPVNLYFYTARHSIQDQVKPNWCGSMLNKVVRVIFLCIVTSYFYIGCSFTELKKMHCKFLNPKTHWYLSIFKTFFVCAWKDVAWARCGCMHNTFQSSNSSPLLFVYRGNSKLLGKYFVKLFLWKKVKKNAAQSHRKKYGWFFALPFTHAIGYLSNYACNIWSGSSWNSDIWFCCLLPIMESFI